MLDAAEELPRLIADDEDRTADFLGLRSEVTLGIADGLPHESSIRCDFLTLMFKQKLTHFVGTLSASKVKELNRALRYALELGE